MHLVQLCTMDLGYVGGFHSARPYGNEAGIGWGIGDGTATGDQLSGDVKWSNHPTRRGDGMMLPNLRGIIVTADGHKVFFDLGGRTTWVERADETLGRQLFAAFFESEAETYKWLNDEVCMAEGVVDPEHLTFHLDIHLCKNDLI